MSCVRRTGPRCLWEGPVAVVQGSHARGERLWREERKKRFNLLSCVVLGSPCARSGVGMGSLGPGMELVLRRQERDA